MFCRTIVYVWRNYFLINCCSTLRFSSVLFLLSFASNHPSDCLLPTAIDNAVDDEDDHRHTRCEFTIHFIRFHSIPFHTIRYLPRTTKWYTAIKQFKFISVCDQFCAPVSHFDFSEGLSVQLLVSLLLLLYFHSKHLLSVCPGIFMGWFSLIRWRAYCFHSSAHGIFHFEISCVKWCISLRTQYSLATHESYRFQSHTHEYKIRSLTLNMKCTL